MVYRAGHDIARGQFCPLIEALHEALAVGQLEVGPFTAKCLGDQKALGLRVIQASGVKLVELKVRHPAAGTPGHGDAVAAGSVRVAGVQVDLGGAARRQDGEARAVRIHFATVAIEHIGTKAALSVQAETAFGDQVDGSALLEQFDVGSLDGLFQQGAKNGGTCGICSMNDPPMAMAAFTRQVKFKSTFVGVCVIATSERHALIDQPLNRLAAVFDSETHSVFVAKAAACVQRVLNMRLHGVGVIQHCRNTALRPECRAIGEIALAQDCNPQVVGQGQCQAQSGSSAADYQYVMLKMLTHLRILPLATTSISIGVTAQ